MAKTIRCPSLVANRHSRYPSHPGSESPGWSGSLRPWRWLASLAVAGWLKLAGQPRLRSGYLANLRVIRVRAGVGLSPRSHRSPAVGPRPAGGSDSLQPCARLYRPAASVGRMSPVADRCPRPCCPACRSSEANYGQPQSFAAHPKHAAAGSLLACRPARPPPRSPPSGPGELSRRGGGAPQQVRRALSRATAASRAVRLRSK